MLIGNPTTLKLTLDNLNDAEKKPLFGVLSKYSHWLTRNRKKNIAHRAKLVLEDDSRPQEPAACQGNE